MSCGINLSDRLPLNLKQVSKNPSFLEEEEKKFEDLFGTKMKEKNISGFFGKKVKKMFLDQRFCAFEYLVAASLDLFILSALKTSS